MYTVEHFPQYRHPFVVCDSNGSRVEAFNTRTQAEDRAVYLNAEYRNEMADFFSDLYKDVYGMRPRILLARAQAEGWTVQDFVDEIEVLKRSAFIEPEFRSEFDALCPTE